MNIVNEGKWCRVEHASREEIESIAKCLTFFEDEDVYDIDIDLDEELELTWEDKLDHFVFLQQVNGKFKFLSGLLPYFKDHYSGQFTVQTEYTAPVRWKVEIPEDYLDGITFRGYQKHAVEKSLYFRKGILHIPTRGGKTEVMIGIAKYYLENINPSGKILFVEPDGHLMGQTYKRCLKRGLKDVGRLGDGHRELDHSVLICIVNSLYNIVKDPSHKDFNAIQETTAIIVDEVHHLGSPSMAQAPIVIPDIELFIGVSGSPFNDEADPHTNPRDVAIIGLLHQVIMKVSPRYLMNKGYIGEPHVFIMGYGGGGYPRYFVKNYNKVYNKFLLWHSGRNAMITQIAELFNDYEFNLLILVTRIDHGKFLLKRINSFSPNALFAFGGGNVIRHYGGVLPDDLSDDEWDWYADKEDKKKGNKYIGLKGDQGKLIDEHFEGDEPNILIGSTVFDEGVDLPTVDALIIAGGQGRSDVKNIQRPARALTRNDGRNYVYIIDFWDDRHKYLKKHSKLRIDAYKKNQYYIHTGGVDELEESIKETVRIENEIRKGKK